MSEEREQAEPVGYFVNDESDDQWHQVDYEQRNGADTYPLYLHPPADEVQQAEPEYWIATDGGDMIAAFSRKEAWVDFCDEVSPLEAFPVYRHPPPAEEQAKPIAWMFDRRYGSGLSFGRPADYENEDGDTISPTPLFKRPIAAPQQAEPAAQIGWADEFGNLFPMGAWKPAQRTHHDSHKTAWRAVYLHPPAAELARLRAENERLRADNVHLRGHFEKAWPDTQRYRWLRATNMEQQNILAHYAYTEMDAAIDAAMAQGKV